MANELAFFSLLSFISFVVVFVYDRLAHNVIFISVQIIYMDFVEMPRLLASSHRIEYSLPRACFVCNGDFKLIEEIDRNMLSLHKIEFGKRNFGGDGVHTARGLQ